MNTHVFIVNEQTFKLHLEYKFAGIGNKEVLSTFLTTTDISAKNFSPITERNLVCMIADISRIQIGDNIIFYLQSTGGQPGRFFGVFKAKTRAFFDENDSDNFLKKELGKGLSYRILIEPSEHGVFPEGVTEHDYLDSLEDKSHPYELCWSLIYRKLKANRGCTMITDFEFSDLLKKLKYINKEYSLQSYNYTYDTRLKKIAENNKDFTYNGRTNSLSIKERLLYKIETGHAFEVHLQAYILQNILSLNLLDFPGMDFWIGNEVSCGVGMQRIDILIIQEKDNEIFIKVIELKCVEPTRQILDYQLDWYIKWLCDYIIPNYQDKTVEVTPCIVAKKTNDEDLIDYMRSKCFNTTNSNITIKQTEYFAINENKSKIDFEKIL
ncbi:hypothetical protein [uncultured Finegoldia sp.]|uniref:hypothetical protein n=1 Tax=uncultured Finegoldia sp. TaxID=328009 RepID=UPI0026227D59|nr:hypothetical protein [uncultured Finegoldia sp.]